MADKYVQSSPTYNVTDGTLLSTERVGPQGQLLVDQVHGESRRGTAVNHAVVIGKGQR